MAEKKLDNSNSVEVKYKVAVDYDGLERWYTSLSAAKSSARRLVNGRYAGLCCQVSVEVLEVTITYRNGKPIKGETTLVTTYEN